MISRIYIDTSIVGGYFDEEFKEATGLLFKRLENREIKSQNSLICISTLCR